MTANISYGRAFLSCLPVVGVGMSLYNLWDYGNKEEEGKGNFKQKFSDFKLYHFYSKCGLVSTLLGVAIKACLLAFGILTGPLAWFALGMWLGIAGVQSWYIYKGAELITENEKILVAAAFC